MELAPMKTTRALLLLALAAMLPAAHAQTGKWPERPVRTVVPFAPGGAIGVEIVVRANPDGYTILVGASSYASNVPLYKLTYDPIEGISPVALITRGPFQSGDRAHPQEA